MDDTAFRIKKITHNAGNRYSSTGSREGELEDVTEDDAFF